MSAWGTGTKTGAAVRIAGRQFCARSAANCLSTSADGLADSAQAGLVAKTKGGAVAAMCTAGFDVDAPIIGADVKTGRALAGASDAFSAAGAGVVALATMIRVAPEVPTGQRAVGGSRVAFGPAQALIAHLAGAAQSAAPSAVFRVLG